MDTPKLSGLMIGLSITLLYAGWTIATRFGLNTHLSVGDLMALRLFVACVIALPILLYHKPWQGLRLRQYAILGFLGGLPHSLLAYGALERISVAHFSVFLYGMAPVATALISYLLLRKTITKPQAIGAVLILGGIVSLGYDGFAQGLQAETWVGALMAVGAITSFAGYMVFAERWHVTAAQAIMACTVLNGLLYLPFWGLFMESQLVTIPASDLVIQGLFQGMIPGILALYTTALATKALGANVTSLFYALIPVTAAGLAVPFLGEAITVKIIFGLFVTTGGIIIATFQFKTSKAAKSFSALPRS